MKTPQQIEEMAEKAYMSEYYDPNDLSMSNSSYNAGYLNGYTQAQKDLLESASGGFEECFKNGRNSKGETPSQIEVWQACALSYEKKLKEEREAFSFTSEARIKELQEKDAEIERLKLKLDSQGDKENQQYKEAVKDIAFLMSHASTEWIGSWKLEEIKTKYGLDKKEG